MHRVRSSEMPHFAGAGDALDLPEERVRQEDRLLELEPQSSVLTVSILGPLLVLLLELDLELELELKLKLEPELELELKLNEVT